MERPKIKDFIKEAIANPSIELIYLKDYVKELEAYADKQEEDIAVIQCCTSVAEQLECKCPTNPDTIKEEIEKNKCFECGLPIVAL